MNAYEKIQHFTGTAPKKVEEWEYVYWVLPHAGRPTMYSKKIVDRAAEIEVRTLSGDIAARDNKTGKAYILRSNFGMGYSIKEVAPGQAISEYSEFPLVRGQVVARTSGYDRRPKTVSGIIALLAANAA